MEKIVFDLIGVISKEKMFASELLYPAIKDKISYNEFKKRYILYCVGMLNQGEFWDGIMTEKKVIEFEKKFFEETVLFNKNIILLIQKLYSRGYELYIASEIPGVWGDMILEASNIKDCFKKIYYSSDLKHTKPFFPFFDKVFNDLSLHGETSYFIDDTIHNLIAVKKFFPEVKTILFQGGRNNLDEVDYQTNNIKELEDILYDS